MLVLDTPRGHMTGESAGQSGRKSMAHGKKFTQTSINVIELIYINESLTKDLPIVVLHVDLPS